jgi:hypothetical protein
LGFPTNQKFLSFDQCQNFHKIGYDVILFPQKRNLNKVRNNEKE